ncbi:biliverdin-producing heme oxygenase [Roseibium sp. CAU 1637]|uniref:Biliverdin-producing heme oxygenase n=2 Tax=Roseibium TaxID=150830 RepID=A0A939EL87_9HYPH|nr:biliverdin-producing heme oxygenase [Roseibium limicola]MBO0344681.1 biliverdin-producing heme oxygenase [Roseibium limicola]
MTKHCASDDDIRFHLSRATRALHDLVDVQAEHNDLETTVGVASLIAFFHKGFSQIEAALDRADAATVLSDWESRKRTDLLENDLNGLGIGDTTANEAVQAGFSFDSQAEIWGGLYVIEGSRLGARMLVRASDHTRASAFLSESATCRFWPDFVIALTEADQSLQDRNGMVRGAEKAFQAFLSQY